MSNMKNKGLITEDNILIDFNVSSKEEAIDKLTELLVELGAVLDKPGFLKDIYERESRGFTFAGDYLAIPHGWSKHVVRTAIVVLKTKDSIVWDEKGNLVKLIIMFVIPEGDEMGQGLKMIGQLFSSLGDVEAVKKLLDADTKKEIARLICNYADTKSKF